METCRGNGATAWAQGGTKPYGYITLGAGRGTAYHGHQTRILSGIFVNVLGHITMNDNERWDKDAVPERYGRQQLKRWGGEGIVHSDHNYEPERNGT